MNNTKIEKIFDLQRQLEYMRTNMILQDDIYVCVKKCNFIIEDENFDDSDGEMLFSCSVKDEDIKTIIYLTIFVYKKSINEIEFCKIKKYYFHVSLEDFSSPFLEEAGEEVPF